MNTDNFLLANKLQLLVNSSWIAQAINVAVELQIAELLVDGPKTTEYLANKTKSHAQALHQLLRALTTIDICRELSDGSFELTEMGNLLREDHSESLRSWTLWWTTNLQQAWGNLLYSVKTGESTRMAFDGTEGFQHLDEDPKKAAIFNQALVELTHLTVISILDAYDFSKFKKIVDVGGGYGELLLSILKSHQNLSGVLFDRPHALEGARSLFEKEGIAGQCAFTEGDFFKSLPDGADAYVLKSVIHDWDDQKSKRILQNCHHAMGSKGTLILVERILPDFLDTSDEHKELARTDLTMLVAFGSGERTEAQYKRLLDSAGFRINQIIPIGNTFSLIEALPST